MRVIAALVILTVVWSVAAVIAGPAEAQGLRGAPSYPCEMGQIKGDWSTTLYYLPSQVSYAAVGSGYSSDIACFWSEQQALDYGFRKAYR